MNRRAPFIIRAAERILGEDHHCLIGDIEWTYRSRSEENSPFLAVLWLWWAVFSLVPRLFVRDLIWQHTMLKSYLTVALRQFNKYKSFSIINVLGLALSMSVCLLILTMIQDFRSDDSFHENADRIYRITSGVTESWGSFETATSSVMLGPELMRELDDVESIVQMMRTRGELTRDDGRMSTFAGLYVQPTFFEFFDFKFVKGNPEHALSRPFQIVITEELAGRLFPDRDPIGELVERATGMFEVTGVLARPERRTHLDFDVLISFSTLGSLYADQDANPLDSWGNNTRFYNYLMLRNGASISRIEDVANIMGVAHHTSSESDPAAYSLQSITAINLGKDLSNEIGDVLPGVFAIVFSLFALLLIGMAAFNYVNLTVSRALKRRAEIGVRKVVGAHRRQLIQPQQLLLPQFNSLGEFSENGKQISMSSFDPILLIKFVVFAVILGLFAGIVPALRVSRQSPVAADHPITGSETDRPSQPC